MKTLCRFLIVMMLWQSVSLSGADLSQDLIDAIKAGNMSAAEVALSGGADVNTRLKNGASPLIVAADLGHTALAELLIKRGADVNAANKSNATALFFAAARGNVALVKVLIAHGAKVDETNDRGDMPLRYAMDTGDAELIEALIAAGAPLNESFSESGVPALLYAVERGDFDAVSLLLKHGANVNQTDGNGCTPLTRAAEKNLAKLIHLLLSKGANINAIHSENNGGEHNALCCAAVNGAEASVRLLLANGLDPHWKEDLALHLAEAKGHKGIVALLKGSQAATKPASLPELSIDASRVFPLGGTPVVAAISSFTTDDNSWKSGQLAQGFSAVLQAQLGDVPSVTWVERDAIHRAEAELKLQAFGILDQAGSLRLGKWLNARLLVTGRFGVDEGEGSRLTVEVLDLHRADVLAHRSWVIKMPADKRFAFTEADVKATIPMVRAALTEAMSNLEASTKQVIVAPLFFRNASGTSDRLDFLEGDLIDAFSKGSGQKVRVVKFPQAARASEESELVLSGLVDANPEAWKRVADHYIWGDFEEIESNGVAFDEVKVRLRLQVWNGATSPTEHATVCRVGELREAIPRFADSVLATLRDKPRVEPKDSVREELARALHERMLEIQSHETEFIEAHQRTVGWTHRWRLRLQLLELAHFLSPGDGSIHGDLIVERWNQSGVFHGPRDEWQPAQFWALWRRDVDWRNHVERFGFNFLNALARTSVMQMKLPGELSIPGEMEKAPRQDYFVEMARVTSQFIGYRVGGYPDEVPQNVHVQWRRDFATEMAKRLILMADQFPDQFTIPPALYVEELGRIREASVRADAAVALWKLSGRVPSNPSALVKLKSFVESSLKEAGRETEIVKLLANTSEVQAVATASAQMHASQGTPLNSENWRQSLRDRTQQQLTDPTRLPGEIKTAFTPISMGDEYIVGGGLDQLAFVSGRLLIGGQVQFQQGYRQCSTAWSYDPESKRPLRIAELETSQLQPFTAFVAVGEGVWITSDGSAVMRFQTGSGGVEKFTSRDGLPTEHMHACVVGGGKVFCGGGQDDQGQLASFDLKNRKWSAINCAGPDGLLKKIVAMAFAKDRLMVVERQAQGGFKFSGLNPQDSTWFAMKGEMGGRLTPSVSGSVGIGLGVVCVGDADGYWVAGGTSLCFHDPETGNTETLTTAGRDFDGIITGVANDGDFLWVATVTAERPTSHNELMSPRLYALRKKTRKVAGFLRVPYNGPINCLTASQDKLWLGIDTRHESEVYLVEVEKKAFTSVPASDWKPLGGP